MMMANNGHRLLNSPDLLTKLSAANEQARLDASIIVGDPWGKGGNAVTKIRPRIIPGTCDGHAQDRHYSCIHVCLLRNR